MFFDHLDSNDLIGPHNNEQILLKLSVSYTTSAGEIKHLPTRTNFCDGSSERNAVTMAMLIQSKEPFDEWAKTRVLTFSEADHLLVDSPMSRDLERNFRL
jgi:hypothetical protein